MPFGRLRTCWSKPAPDPLAKDAEYRLYGKYAQPSIHLVLELWANGFPRNLIYDESESYPTVREEVGS